MKKKLVEELEERRQRLIDMAKRLGDKIEEIRKERKRRKKK